MINKKQKKKNYFKFCLIKLNNFFLDKLRQLQYLKQLKEINALFLSSNNSSNLKKSVSVVFFFFLIKTFNFLPFLFFFLIYK